MKQRFFTSTIQSNFIKALIYNTPIPLLDSINDNSYLLKDNVYIYKNKIIKCISSGIFKMPEVQEGCLAYYKNGDIKIVKSSPEEEGDNLKYVYETYTPLKRANYRIIDDFVLGRYYPKFTELYCSNYNYYDTKTHEYLGKLLRLYRDIYDINLMPYYNCVSGNYIAGIVIHENRIKEENSKDYKIFKIPIKYNTTYTLALDCNNPVKIAPVLLSNNHIIDNISLYNSTGSLESFNPTNVLLKDNISIFDSASFKQPKAIGVSTLNKEQASLLQKYERYLYLLIQVPKNNESSIVLLEGDYTSIPKESIYNVEGIENLNDLELSNIMTSELSLLQMNDKIIYPYANRLIEYLLWNVISPVDTITKNTERIQGLFVNTKEVQEVWDNLLRSNIYINYQKHQLMKKLDLNGFVDKDTETLIKNIESL